MVDKVNNFWISFIEEGILNPKYEGYVGGRVEVYGSESGYATEEMRFFTKDKSFYEFRERYDFVGVDKRGLDRIRKIIKDKYYDTNV